MNSTIVRCATPKIATQHFAFLVLMGLTILCNLQSPTPAYATSEIPSIEQEFIPESWWIIGPFLAGMREAGTDALVFDREVPSMDDPRLQTTFPSTLVPGGKAHWRLYDSDENGEVVVDYPEVPEESMELVTDEWGFAGGMTVGYAFTVIDIEDGPRRALVDIRRAGGFMLNGLPHPGDPYGFGWAPIPVVLQEGRNELKIAVGSRQRFTFKLMPVEEDLMLLAGSATVPDLVRGLDKPSYLGLPVINTTSFPITINSVDSGDGTLFTGSDWTEVTIPPRCMHNLAINLWPGKMLTPHDLEGDEFMLPIYVNLAGGATAQTEVKLRIRDPEQSRRVTFMSAIDNSVQYFGLLQPTDYDPDRRYALVLTLHGAGVEAIGQVQSYKPKDFAFVVAATNRRPYGFDWQEWGRLDMLEVYNHVLANFPIDEDRVHLTGHSMGGHGTWINSLLFADKWASASPSAGWTTFPLYVPMMLRKNLLLGHPRANLLWQLAMREDDTLMLAENGLNLPFYALQGGADDNVPPQQPRLMSQVLTRLGCDVRYEEVPGKGHWWSNPDTPFTDCVDNERHNKLWREEVRDKWPRRVVFKTHNYSINDSAYWVRKVIPEEPYKDVVVRAEALGDGEVTVTTTNVAGLDLHLHSRFIGWIIAKVTIDGELFSQYADSGKSLRFLKQFDGHWVRVGFRRPALFKTQSQYGPWKQTLMRPFKVVYGTSGSEEQTELCLQLARIYANSWWYRANGRLEVIADSDCNASSGEYNLILLGGADCNSVAAAMETKMPLGRGPGGVRIGNQVITGKDLTYKFVHPNPLSGWNGLVLVEGGTSLEAMQRLPAAMGIYSGAGFPDWMVWDDEFKLRGLGGVVASGFFDMEWQFDPDLSFFNEDLMGRLGE